jgi:D-alanine-D-alanine ligase
VPVKTPCLCGLGPVARELSTPNEAVQRISLVQRTLLLAEFLANQLEEKHVTKRAGK